ncbi:unnamed protein product [Effrenium voratum]|nr:unnamed protein product [Effrenium voratum]
MSRAMAVLLLGLVMGAAAQFNCASVYGESSPTCAWEKEVKTCMDKNCQGSDDGELCRADAARTIQCCEDHYQAVTPPRDCVRAAISSAVLKCAKTSCEKSCNGAACKACSELHEEEEQPNPVILECCMEHDLTDPPEICRAAVPQPCEGLQGEAASTCRWELEVNACVRNICASCSECQNCQKDTAHINTCCDTHLHDAPQPALCKDAGQKALLP